MKFSCKWMKLELIILSEVIQTKKGERQPCIFSSAVPSSKSSNVSKYRGVTTETRRV